MDRGDAVDHLRESEERLQAFMRHTPALAFMKDAAGRYVYINRRMEETFSIRRDDIIGKADFDWLPASIATEVRSNDALVLREGRTLELVERIPMPDGAIRHWMVLKFPFINTHGERFVGGVAIDVSARVQAEELAQRREQDLRALLEHSPDLVVRFDRALRIVFANRTAAAAVGCPPAAMIGQTLSDLGVPPDQRQMLDSTIETVFLTGREAGFEGRFPIEGRDRYFHVRVVPELGDGGRCSTVLMASRDVTRLKLAEKRLIESERRYRLLFENNLGMMCTHDLDGRLLSVNGAAAAALGYDSASLVGRHLGEFLPQEVRHELPEYLDRVQVNGTDQGLLKLIARDGSVRIWKYCNVRLDEPGQPPCVLGSAHDVTELKQAQDAARRLSLTDELTGLVNRRGFMTLAEQHLRLMRRVSGEVMILYADLDDLKQINDRFGHEQGSAALRAVAEVMKTTFRRTDVVGRLGGDEFVVMMVEPKPDDATAIPRRLARNLRAYNNLGRHAFELSLSVGTVIGRAEPGTSLEQLIAAADDAMYAQKHGVRNAS